MARVTIRYWAGARDAAGVDAEGYDAGTVDEALGLARRRRAGDAEFARVLGLCSFLLDGRRVGPADRARPLAGDVELEALPPFAGG